MKTRPTYSWWKVGDWKQLIHTVLVQAWFLIKHHKSVFLSLSKILNCVFIINITLTSFRSASSDRRHSQSGTNTVSRLELRYPSRFTPETGKPANAIHTVVEEDHYKSTKNDRTVNYRKCICPFILGILLMFAGIALCTYVINLIRYNKQII